MFFNYTPDAFNEAPISSPQGRLTDRDSHSPLISLAFFQRCDLYLYSGVRLARRAHKMTPLQWQTLSAPPFSSPSSEVLFAVLKCEDIFLFAVADDVFNYTPDAFNEALILARKGA